MTTNTQNSSTTPTRSQPPNRLRGQHWRERIAQSPHQITIRRMNRIRNALGLSSWSGIHCLHAEGLVHFRDRNELVVGDRLTGWVCGDDFGQRERLGERKVKTYQQGSPGRLGGIDLVRREDPAVAILCSPQDLIGWRTICLSPALKPNGQRILPPLLWTNLEELPDPQSCRAMEGKTVLIFPGSTSEQEAARRMRDHLLRFFEIPTAAVWEAPAGFSSVHDLAQASDRGEGVPGEPEPGLIAGDDLGLTEFLEEPTVGFSLQKNEGAAR